MRFEATLKIYAVEYADAVRRLSAGEIDEICTEAMMMDCIIESLYFCR